jgi:NAD(P)H-nitrite reductase large subunit
MQSVQMPTSVSRVSIFLDGDVIKFTPTGMMAPVGQTAARALKDRLEREGRDVTIINPPHRSDWLDN